MTLLQFRIPGKADLTNLKKSECLTLGQGQARTSTNSFWYVEEVIPRGDSGHSQPKPKVIYRTTLRGRGSTVILNQR